MVMLTVRDSSLRARTHYFSIQGLLAAAAAAFAEAEEDPAVVCLFAKNDIGW